MAGDLADWLPLPPALRGHQKSSAFGTVSLKSHILSLSVMELEFLPMW